MRTKTFLVTFLSFMVLLFCSALLIYLQMQTIKNLRLGVLENKLYIENTGILAWSMKNVDLEKLGRMPLPSSWGEILIVDNTSLTIKSSTDQRHAGMSLYKIPQLLDQASPVIDAMKKGRDETVKTKNYMIALSPLPENSTIIGFKPKEWERGLISEQNDQIQRNTRSITTILIFYVAGGLACAVVLSLIIVFILTMPVTRAAKAFEQLSLGNFDKELPRSGGKVMVSLSDSFFRLKTSLILALEKLGSR